MWSGVAHSEDLWPSELFVVSYALAGLRMCSQPRGEVRTHVTAPHVTKVLFDTTLSLLPVETSPYRLRYLMLFVRPPLASVLDTSCFLRACGGPGGGGA